MAFPKNERTLNHGEKCEEKLTYSLARFGPFVDSRVGNWLENWCSIRCEEGERGARKSPPSPPPPPSRFGGRHLSSRNLPYHFHFERPILSRLMSYFWPAGVQTNLNTSPFHYDLVTIFLGKIISWNEIILQDEAPLFFPIDTTCNSFRFKKRIQCIPLDNIWEERKTRWFLYWLGIWLGTIYVISISIFCFAKLFIII